MFRTGLARSLSNALTGAGIPVAREVPPIMPAGIPAEAPSFGAANIASGEHFDMRPQAFFAAGIPIVVAVPDMTGKPAAIRFMFLRAAADLHEELAKLARSAAEKAEVGHG